MRLIRVLSALMVGALVLGAPAAVVQGAATTFTVTKTADTNDGTCDADCSLREAITAANANAGTDTIDIPAGTYSLTISGVDEDAAATGDLDVTDDLTISGAGAAATIIDGGGLDRVLHIHSGNTVGITGVTVQGGTNLTGGGVRNEGSLTLDWSTVSANGGGNGGGLFNSGGTLTIKNSTITGNTVTAPGGGIWSNSALTITNSTITDNQAQLGGGILNFQGSVTISGSTISGNRSTSAFLDQGGGLFNSAGSITITSSTISGNTTDDDGGGIFSSGGSVVVDNSTISGNSASGFGGGIRTTGGTLTLKNTIIVNSAAGGDCSGAVTSLGHNLASDSTCSLGATGDLGNTNPLLGPLQDNGGPTFTHALLAGSPAIDAGDDDAASATDQRGVTRPQGTASDIGAFEFGASVFTVTKTADTNDGTCDADCSLREAITAANANAGTDTIAFAIPGVGPHTIQPTSALPTITDPVIIDGYTQPGASPNTNTVASGLGLNTVLKIELDGTSAGVGARGLHISAGSSRVRGLTINRFGNGIWVETSGGNVIDGNFIGTDTGGVSSLGNVLDGLVILSPNNVVGGTTAEARNLISGNSFGVDVFGGAATAGNVIQGNLIGTDVTGTTALGNLVSGVEIRDDASTNIVGGLTPSARNVISGNRHGITILGLQNTTGNLVQGNFIGTDVTGTTGLGNTKIGVRIAGAGVNTIGGAAPGAGNVISGNGTSGIGFGSFAEGGFGPFQPTGIVIQGNLIGTDATGIAPLGNGTTGISLTGNDHSVGGVASGAGNTIAFNGFDGVFVFASDTGNAIFGNAIFSNTGLGIDLEPDGVTPNDAGDGDAGANNLQNFPVLTSAVTGGNPIVIGGTLDSAASTDFRVEFFANSACDPSGNGEGETFLGAATATTDAGGSADFSVLLTKAVSLGAAITATATDPNNNTSEFSACITAGAAAPVPGISWPGLAGLAALLAGAFAWTVRRRQRAIVA